MSVVRDSSVRRVAGVVVAVAVGFGSVALWSAADPEASLRLRVIAALTVHEVWAVGTDVQVVGRDVRVQGFVRSEAERARVVAVVAGVAGVGRVSDRLSLTAWPEPPARRGSPQVALLAGSTD